MPTETHYAGSLEWRLCNDSMFERSFPAQWGSVFHDGQTNTSSEAKKSFNIDCYEGNAQQQIGQWARRRNGHKTLREFCSYEGVDLPIEESKGGEVYTPVHQLRDPAILVVEREHYLYYSVAGEQGIGMARFSKLK